MIQLLRDPAWQFLGIVLGLITIGISIFIFYRQRHLKCLGYEILTNTPLLTVDEKVHGKLEIFYDKIQVTNIHLLLLKLTNNGNVPITTNDFERPLTISFESSNNFKIISSEVIDTSPSDLAPVISNINNEITLSPLLFNSNDYITIKILLSEPQGEFLVTARIVGVERVKFLKESAIKRWLLFAIGIISGLLSSSILWTIMGRKYLIICFLMIILAIIYILINQKRKISAP